MNRRPVFVAAVGDPWSPVTWSGTPFHLLQAGLERGLFRDGLHLVPGRPTLRAGRWLWNAWRRLGDRSGGYQYSIPFLEALWRPVRGRLPGAAVVNCFQLYPPSLVGEPDVERWYFVDQTLRQLFDHYGQRSTVGARIADEAEAREGEGYRSAAGVVVHSRWAARSVVEDHRVEPGKVHVVVPGANLDPWLLGHRDAEEARRRDPDPAGAMLPGRLRLVFVGKEWERKGLDRLLEALALARGAGHEVTLRVIGCPRSAVPRHLQGTGGVEWAGFVSKRTETPRFLRLVGEADLGCLLSRAEAGGIGQREYLALGLGVLGTTAGGASEHVWPEASELVPVEADPPAIAELLAALAGDPTRVRRLRAAAWRRRHEATWPFAVAALARCMGRGAARPASSEPGPCAA